MIFAYSKIINDAVKKKKLNYDIAHNYGIETIKIKIKEYADTINESFVDQLLLHTDIDFIFYTTNDKFTMKNTIGIITYRKTNEIIYLLIVCIDKKYRKYGYGTAFIQEFIEYIKQNHKNVTKIILESIDKAENFYEKFGFIKICSKENINFMELEI